MINKIKKLFRETGHAWQIITAKTPQEIAILRVAEIDRQSKLLNVSNLPIQKHFKTALKNTKTDMRKKVSLLNMCCSYPELAQEQLIKEGADPQANEIYTITGLIDDKFKRQQVYNLKDLSIILDVFIKDQAKNLKVKCVIPSYYTDDQKEFLSDQIRQHRHYIYFCKYNFPNQI